MTITPVKVVLFLAGGTVAAGGTAYFAGLFDNILSSPPTMEASAPNAPNVAALPPSENPAASGASEQASVKPEAGTSTTEPSSANSQGTEAPGVAKVEVPSFDIVRVEPGGSIVIAGHAAANAKVEAIIGSRIIGSANAGPEGDFAIVLEKPLTPGDYSIVLRSTTPDNVVAMSVETAVVSIPDTPAGQVLALVEEPGKPSQLITVPEPKGKPADAAAKPAEGSTGISKDAEGADSNTGDGAAAQAETQPAQKGERVQQDVATATEQPSGKQDAQASAAAGQAAENRSGAETKQAAGEEIASAGEQAKSNAATNPATADAPKVSVEAVEIEGRKIFVAGSATPGTNLRAYANEILLGDASASKGGRFLIEAERDLPVGDYIIRVDALGPDGVKVLARAAVPFEREAGENISAVARTGSANEAKPASAATGGASESGSLPIEQHAAAGGATNSEGSSGTGESSQAASGQQMPAHSESAASEHDGSAAQPAEVAAVTQKMQPGTADALAPKLQSVDGSVIIRRGDSLWRISKRVYGRGVRYSTIYLANQDQIRDPHKIWPGQVFKVPEKTGEGEKADMTRLGEQAIQPPVAAQ